MEAKSLESSRKDDGKNKRSLTIDFGFCEFGDILLWLLFRLGRLFDRLFGFQSRGQHLYRDEK